LSSLTEQLNDLQETQRLDARLLKNQLDENTSRLLAPAPSSPKGGDEDGAVDTIALATGQCLCCGRLSSIHGNACHTGSIVYRPDSGVLRGGFRMPVSTRPKSAHQVKALSLSPGPPGGSETAMPTSFDEIPGDPNFTTHIPSRMLLNDTSRSLDMLDTDSYANGDADGNGGDEEDNQLVGDPYVPRYASVRPKTASKYT
jgi:hypothetical protein